MADGKDDPPTGALTWASAAERKKALFAWRRACYRNVKRSPHQLRVASALEGLFSGKGWAFPSNDYLSREIGMPTNHVEDGLMGLERLGLIIRQRLKKPNGQTERRIWPSGQLVARTPQKLGGGATPRNRPPETGGQKVEGKAPYRRDALSNEQRRARHAADSKGGWEPGTPASWLDAD